MKNQFTEANKIPYVVHLVFDLVIYWLAYHFLGFEITIIFILTNIGCDIVRGFATLIELLNIKK